MTKTDEEMIAIMQAHLRGEAIEYRLAAPDGRVWERCDLPGWNWVHCEYRIAPQPSPDIAAMVRRFLTWKLPADFNPDCGITFQRTYPGVSGVLRTHEPVGTNLFTFEQAKAMVLHMLAGDAS